MSATNIHLVHRPICKYHLRDACAQGDSCPFSHQSKTAASESSVCKYFLLNTCSRGDACQFFHPHSQPTASNAGKLSICPHFLRGNCRFGDRCRHSHPANGHGESTSLHSPDPIGSTKPSASLSRTPVDPSDLPAQAWGGNSSQEPASSGQEKLSKPCWFFSQGKCTKGSACPFSHIIAVGEDHTASTLVLGGNLLQEPASPHRKKIPQVCVYFSRGACRDGPTCPFSHSVEKGNVTDRFTTEPLAPNNRHEAGVGRSQTSKQGSPFSPSQKGANSEVHMVRQLPLKKEGKASASRNHTQPNTVFEATRPEASPSTVRSIFNCTVQFGSGAAVEQVITAFESRRVVLSNLIPSVTEADVISLISPFVDSASVLVNRSPALPLPTATVEFPNSAQAAQAVPKLHDIKFEANRVVARLDLRARAVENGTGTLLSRKVKIIWFVPGLSALAHYSTLAVAQTQAKRLDGMTFEGRRIKASLYNPGRRPFLPTSFTVSIRNLAPNPSIPSLQTFCEASQISFESTYHVSDSPLDNIRELLTRYGPLDTLDTLPTGNSNKTTAFAQFSTAEAAAAAVKGLDGVPQSFLGKKPLLIHQVHSIKYSVRARQFLTVKADLLALADTHNKDPRLRYYDHDQKGKPSDPVNILIHGSDPKALGRVKVDLEKILRGEPLLVDGKDVWDEYFDSPVGQWFIRGINSNAPFFAKYDSRTRTIRLFGSEADRTNARNLILEQLKEVHARRHILPLKKELVRSLLEGGLKSLHDEVGKEKVILNVVARTLTIQGELDDVNRVRRAIAEMRASASTLGSAPESLCPVCFCEVTDPIKLDCGHIYCIPCLQHLLRSAAGPSFFLLKCMADKPTEGVKASPCNAAIPYGIIRDLLSSPEEKSLLESSFLSHIHARPKEFCYCPSPDCHVVYRPGARGTVFQCPSCLIRICAACHVEFHEGMTCAEHQDNLNGGLQALARWRNENGVKPCPNCQADIEKNGGCNHIQCARCKIHICWVCMKTFSDGGSDGGVYPHMTREHGGFGI